MSVFIGVHDMGSSVTDGRIEKSWETYKAACTKLGCTPLTAYSSAEKGKAFCVTEASSAGEVQKAHDEAGVPINEILEVKVLE
jgi:hypothetical protein